MLKPFDILLLIGFVYYFLKLDIKNEKMVMMEIKNNSVFKDYSNNLKHVFKKHHPDFNESANLETMENIQTINAKFFKSEKSLQRYLLELFIIGDLDENDLTKIKSIFKIITKILIANSLSAVFIFSKITGGKRILLSLLVLALFLIVHIILVFLYYLYLFNEDRSPFEKLRYHLNSSIFCQYLAYSTVNEIISLVGFFQVVFVFLFTLSMSHFNPIQKDFTILFPEMVKKVKEANFGPGKQTEAQQNILREIINTIDAAQGKDSKIWKILQTIFAILSIILVVSQGI